MDFLTLGIRHDERRVLGDDAEGGGEGVAVREGTIVACEVVYELTRREEPSVIL